MNNFFRIAAAVLIAGCQLAGIVLADDGPVREDGLFVTVPNPITSEATNRVKEIVDRAINGGSVKKIIFDFNPSGQPASSRDFGPCYDLAEYLEQQHQITTVAFVHAKTTRHTVLPVLACREIVMSSEASLGDVLPDDGGSPKPMQEQAYARMAGRGREALVLKMLDRNLVLLEGRTRAGAVWFLDGRKRAEAEREGIDSIDPQPILPAGTLALYSAAAARKYNLCQQIRDSRQEVAELYQLPATSLREDPLNGRSPVAFKLVINGPVNKALEERLGRQIRYCIRRGANTIVLQLECSGGDYAVARSIADYLRSLKGLDGLPVMTIAFIPSAAPDRAAFLALGCTEIVMGKGATLGGFVDGPKPAGPPPGRGRRNPPPEPAQNLDLVRESLIALAQEQGVPPILIQGMFDNDLEIIRVRSKAGAGERRFVAKAELDALGDRWVSDGQIKAPGQLLVLTADKAKDYGIVRHVVDNPSEINEVYSLYGFEGVKDPPPDWLQGLADFLGEPVVAMLLVIIGVTCLILELKMPGIGIPGVIAALCFVLFFWSQSQMNGQITLLAILLFLLGLALIGIEIFLIPGFGVAGISGVLLVLIGLGLATVEHMPQSRSEWISFGSTLTTFGFGIVVAGVAAFFLARYLPNIPYANRLVLEPPIDRPNEAGDSAASHYPDMMELLGAVGTSATMLRPSGMAKFGDAYVDVVSEGGYVPAGARVQVVEIEGHRVVVKEV